MEDTYLGIDVGTQGARVVLITAGAEIVATASESFALSTESRTEQDPEGWWQACLNCLQMLSVDERAQEAWKKVRAVAVTSTSGTIIPLDAAFKPLHAALMYSDQRSAPQAERCTAMARQHLDHGYTAFNSSTALAKIVWFTEVYPEKTLQVRHWVHAADYITAKLGGVWGITDQTNALKTGYDLTENKWPDYLFESLPLQSTWLPEVKPSGTVIAQILPELARMLNLPAAVAVTTGMTDGCASQLASGAVNPGDWNTTIGTTLVIKGVTNMEVNDPQGRIYNHRHPAGYWMPGGASNTGADWISQEFASRLQALNEAAEKLIPTGLLAYPLQQQGERFPMIAPQARGFYPEGLSDEERYTANLEGVAYLERYALELLQGFTGEQINAVYTAGGGSNSEIWIQLRSHVLNLPVHKMKEVSGAVGAAILAASGTGFKSLAAAASAMTKTDRTYLPDPALAAVYEGHYQRFLALLRAKGYIRKEENYA